jgi:hypothetical protein
VPTLFGVRSAIAILHTNFGAKWPEFAIFQLFFTFLNTQGGSKTGKDVLKQNRMF